MLTLRPVPATTQPARMLLADLGATAAPSRQLVEVIVSQTGGGTVAIVQPAATGLRAGARVKIVQGQAALAVP